MALKHTQMKREREIERESVIYIKYICIISGFIDPPQRRGKVSLYRARWRLKLPREAIKRGQGFLKKLRQRGQGFLRKLRQVSKLLEEAKTKVQASPRS